MLGGAPPADILPGDALGRGVFQSRLARRARSGMVKSDVFLDSASPLEISVHRLGFVPDATLAALGDRDAKQRGPDRNFYGWAELSAESAAQQGRKVRSSPTPDNPWHADILLPENARSDALVRQRHALKLARNARWRPRPDGE